jgi:hypothetical protein
MKIIGKEEIDTIQWAATSIESFIGFFNFKSVNLKEDEVLKKISVLKNIVSRPDYNVTNHDEFMMAIGRESVNPNYKFCMLSESLMDTLYLTDDYEAALRKAKTLSLLSDHVFSVFSIKNTEEGYKTFYEIQYDGGKPVEPSSYMFLHYDYLSKVVKNIVKL